MRAVDEMECRAFGRSPKQALRLGLIGSTIAYTAKVDGRAEAMMGLTPVSLIEGTGTPWFLGTDEVYRHGRELLAWGPGIVAQMLDSSPSLRQVVSAGNGRALRLLKAWGFTLEDDVQMIGGHPFVSVSLARV